MSPRDLKTCTGQIQELILNALNSAIAKKLLGSVDILKDSYTGTFQFVEVSFSCKKGMGYVSLLWSFEHGKCSQHDCKLIVRW